jgi:hypothetical protein
MQAKMQIYAEILRQIGRMPNESEQDDVGEMEDMGEDDMGEDDMKEPMDHETESSAYETKENKNVKQNKKPRSY